MIRQIFRRERQIVIPQLHFTYLDSFFLLFPWIFYWDISCAIYYTVNYVCHRMSRKPSVGPKCKLYFVIDLLNCEQNWKVLTEALFLLLFFFVAVLKTVQYVAKSVRKQNLFNVHIALGSYLVLQFCRWRYRPVFSGRSKNKHVLSCLLLSGQGKTEIDRPLANKMGLIKAAKGTMPACLF